MASNLDLQNGWYNGFIQGIGQKDSSFQIIEPAPPIDDQNAANQIFCSYYNSIPPLSLTQQFMASGGNQFYSNYRALMSALTPSRDIDVKSDIGDANWDKWFAYISKKDNVNVNQLPTIFRNWAMIYAPKVANKGSSDYAAILLDPIATAQNALTLLYTDENGLPKPADWLFSYSDMADQLKNAPNRSFHFDSSTMNSNVESSWSKGKNSGFFGLWGGSSSSSSISQQFASSRVIVDASFTNLMVFSNTPGNWYNSGAMSLAFANKTGNPWSPDSSINWDNTFGANGSMQRFAANIVVAMGMTLSVTSDAQYSTLDQTTIKSNGSHGFWPFYCGGSDRSSTNTSTFNQSGNMTINSSSAPGIPIVLGANVLSAAEYTGHSASAASAAFDNALKFAKKVAAMSSDTVNSMVE